MLTRRPSAARAAVLLSVLSISCGRTPTGGGDPPVRSAQILGANLVAGGEGVLTGNNLDLITTTIVVDDRVILPSSRTRTEIRFAMPPARDCEVDGRLVPIAAGSLTYSARLAVTSALRMEPGESRVLSRETLASGCLQLPAADQSFVLTALNPALDEASAPDPLFTVQVWTEGQGAQSVAAAREFPRSSDPDAPPVARFDIRPGNDRYSLQPMPFDSAYATAGVGDTVRWVDFHSPRWYNDGNICREPRSNVPTFGAVVAAVSSSGNTVIAFDARTAYHDEWTSAPGRARLTRLADIIERWTLPAVREVFDPGYEPVHGARGRWWHIFRTGVSEPTVDLAGLPQSMCPYYSEVATTLAPDAPLTSDGQVEILAGYLVHEYAHHAEDVIAVRRWGNVFARGAPGWGSVGEAWAQTVQETAARIASNQPTAARYDALRPGSGVPYADFYTTGYGERPDQSPWAGGRGPYEQGTRLLMFLREQWGDAILGSTRERFYSRVIGLPTYDFAAMAAAAGLDPAGALDRWTLAEATDDLVAPDAAAAHGLPQLRTWVPQDRQPVPQVGRSANLVRPLAVAHGSYAALYFLTEGAGTNRGVSLTFADLDASPFIARITRLR